MNKLFSRLAPKPSDYGGLPGKITHEDDAGNVYDETGRKIYNKFDSAVRPTNWLETALDVATAPAKLATGLAGSLNPFSQDGGLQVPPIISEPIDAFRRSGELTGFRDDGRFYLPNVRNPQSAADISTQLMTLYGGNALNPLAKVPKGGLASAAIKEAAPSLPMDQASRLARAKEMGFDTPAWHATRDEIGDYLDILPPDEYNSGMFWVAHDPSYTEAKRYTGTNGMVYPLMVKPGKQLDITKFGADTLVSAEDMNAFFRNNSVYIDRHAVGTWGERLYDNILGTEGAEIQEYLKLPEVHKALKDAGYDSVTINEWTAGSNAGPQRTTGFLNPGNIRSVNAAFDPARAGENGLLLSDNRPSVLGSALASAQSSGMAGVNHLDQMSRDAGQGSRNVVFDDSLIEILRKYGWLAPGAM